MMSARSQIALVALLTAGLAGCVDTSARFDEFGDRIPDAAPEVDEPDAAPLANIPDVTGTHLFALAAVIAPEPPFLFTGTYTLEGNAISISLVGMHRFERTLLDMEPLVSNDNPVDDTGAFVARFEGKIAGDANVISGSELTVDITLEGRILDEDTMCGDAVGDILAPIELNIDGSTFGSVRMEPPVEGDELPTPLSKCPGE